MHCAGGNDGRESAAPWRQSRDEAQPGVFIGEGGALLVQDLRLPLQGMLAIQHALHHALAKSDLHATHREISTTPSMLGTRKLVQIPFTDT